MARADTAALALILAGGLLATPAPGGSQALPDGDYFVKNNSSERLRCRYKVGEGRWRSAFTFRPGAEFKLAWRPDRDEVLFFCEPPARRVSYRLAPGKRLSLLRADDGAIELREITAGGDGLRDD